MKYFGFRISVITSQRDFFFICIGNIFSESWALKYGIRQGSIHFAVIYRSSLRTSEYILNIAVTNFTNAINFIAAELRQTKTRPVCFVMIQNLLYETKSNRCTWTFKWGTLVTTLVVHRQWAINLFWRPNRQLYVQS